MRSTMRAVVTASVLLGGVLAQNGAYQQCGGKEWHGGTGCEAGWTCTSLNEWYSQCLPGGGSSSTIAGPVTTTTAAVSSAAATSTGKPGKFQFFGVSESGAEFGVNNYPGTYGKDYTFPDANTIQTLISEGFNIFRVGFAMERMSPNNVAGPLDAAYLANLTSTVKHITGAGAYAVLDPHNYGRFYGNTMEPAGLKAFWGNLAKEFVDDARVVFDTNNEFHDMDQGLVLQLNQAAIDGIRGSGATSQYIFAEGNQWTGAWKWAATNDNLAGLKDPNGKLVYEMHQYLDADGSGTVESCVSGTIGVERLQSATAWLREKGKVGVLGEFAGGANDVCMQAVEGLLEHLQQNSDVWMGALWWAAGPWWNNYIFSFEPPSGTGYKYYDSLLKKYVA